MQLEYSHEIGTDYATVKFNDTNFKHNVANSLELSYEHIGGKYDLSTNTWRFPLFVSVLIITQIIHNTCFVCGKMMEDSVVEKTQWTVPDGNMKVSTKVRKCVSCGHSHT